MVATVKGRGADPGPSTDGAGQRKGSNFLALHRSKLFDWKPTPVVAISACPGSPLAAVGYDSGDLELWDLSLMACCQRIACDDVGLTSIAWALDSVTSRWRCFASRLDGSLLEVMWGQGRAEEAGDSYGGAVWCLAAQPVQAMKPGFPHRLAAACDDGGLRMYGVEGGEPGVHLERTLASFQGRLLAVAWHPNGASLVTGGMDGCVHLLEAASGREMLRITLASRSVTEQCCWRLAVLGDGTIVSADSEGATQFWDGRFGTLLQRHQAHQGDTLALAALPDGSAVFSAGVDPRVALFTRSTPSSGAAQGQEKWLYLDSKRPHSHDVKALELCQLGEGGHAVLLSGGADGQLIAYPASAFLQEHPARLTKAPQRPICQLALPPAPSSSSSAHQTHQSAHPGRLLCAHHDNLDVWQLAGTAQSVGSLLAATSAAGSSGAAPPLHEGQALELASAPRRLARITTKGARICAAALSPDSRHLMAATTWGLRLYQLQHPGEAQGAEAGAEAGSLQGGLVVDRLTLPGEESASCTAVALTSTHAVAAGCDGTLTCYDLGAMQAVARQRVAGAGGAEEGLMAVAGPSGAGQGQQGKGKQGTSKHLAKQQQAAAVGTWRQYHPHVSCMAASPDGRWLGVAGRGGVSLYSLPDLKPHGKVLQPLKDAPVSGLAFSGDGKLMGASQACSSVLVVDVESCRPLPWCLEHEQAVAACLDRLPGAPIGASLGQSGAQPQMLVYTAGGFCLFDLTSPPDIAFLDRKRRRGAVAPGQHDSDSRAVNGRAVLLPAPCVFLGHLSADACLLLEKPWEEVVATALPKEAATGGKKHKYGS